MNWLLSGKNEMRRHRTSEIILVRRVNGMVRYTRLWETMKKRGVSQYRLIRYYGISAGQMNRMKKNMYVSTHTLEMLCQALQCRVEDIMEVVLQPAEEENEALPEEE